MKTKKILLLAFWATIALQACKTTEKTVDQDKEKQINITVSNKDTILDKNYKTVVSQINIKDTIKEITPKEYVEKKIKAIEGTDTIFEYRLIVNDPTIDTRPPKGIPITTPLPQIFTDLFPDVKWELVIVDEGFGIEYKYYQTANLERRFTYDLVNDFVYSRYKPGKITDKQLIEFFIFWFFHPEDRNMSIKSIGFLANKVENYFNYKSIIIFNNEQVDCYLLVKENKLYGIKTYKNGTLYKQEVLIY